jgi:hypothetical protein
VLTLFFFVLIIAAFSAASAVETELVGDLENGQMDDLISYLLTQQH